MKILESKYHQPRKIITEKYRDNQYFLEIETLDQAASANNMPFSELLLSQRPNVNLQGDGIVIKKEYLADLVKCTDYQTVNFDAKTNHFYESELCYFYEPAEIFLILDENLSNEFDRRVFESGFFQVKHIIYNSMRATALTEVKSFFDKYLEKYVSSEAKISLLLKDGNDLVFRQQTIKPYKLDLSLMYNDDFMPVHQKIKSELGEGKKGVVLLHGLAGTGKTNYIKWLTSQIPDKDFIFVPNNLIGALAEPQFMSLLIERKNSVLVLEDCENYIAERAGGGNPTDVVATILNIADGILSDVLECQFVCTFNADLMTIDHALLRRGRLIAQYQFDKLTADKANAYLASLDRAEQVDVPITLAELVHLGEEEYRHIETKSSFGFV